MRSAAAGPLVQFSSPANVRQSTGDRREQCIRAVTGWLERDRRLADLRWRLKLGNLNRPSISGLSDHDYPLLGDLQVPEFVSLGMRPIPQELVDQYNHIQSKIAMGLFPEIWRAWLTIDSDVYMWNYEDNSDLAYFDALPNTIMKIHLARPKPGVFAVEVQYILVIATTVDIVMMAISFGNANQPGMKENFRHSELNLLPDTLVKIPLDNCVVMDIQSSANGRIFFSEQEGCLYELEYQKKGWFRQACKKVNRSKGLMSYFVPAIVSYAFGKDEPLDQITIDNSRHILFARSRHGAIQVYDLGTDFMQTSKVATLSADRIEQEAAMVCTTVDRPYFRNVVHIAAIPATDSHDLNLVATTEFGVRLYYTCYYAPPATYYSNGTGGMDHDQQQQQQYPAASEAPDLSQERARPLTMRLVHVRLPPGFCNSKVINRPTRTHLGFYSREFSALITLTDDENNCLWALSDSNFPFWRDLAENLEQMPIRGQTWAVARSTGDFDIERFVDLLAREGGPHQQIPTVRPPFVVFQHTQSPARLAVLTPKGVHLYEHRRPVDMLRELLSRFGTDAQTTNAFFQSHGMVQGCAMALMLICSTNTANTPVQEAALRALYVYGGEPTIVYGTRPMNGHESNFIRTPVNGIDQGHHIAPVNDWSSIADLSGQIRSPLQASTPQQLDTYSPSFSFDGSYCQSPPRRPMGTPLPFNRENYMDDNSLLGSPSAQVKYSDRHDAVFLYFSRLVSVLWHTPLCTMRGDQLDSAFRSEELAWLVGQLTALRDALERHSLIPRAIVSPTVTGSIVPPNIGGITRAEVTAATRAQINKKNMIEAAMKERQSFLQFWDILVTSCEVLGLWRILTDHQFYVLTAQLPPAIRDAIQHCTLAGLVFDGQNVCSDLITCLIRQYIADSAATTALSERLRSVCPGLYTCDDAVVAKATEVLQQARQITVPEERERRLRDAVTMMVKVVSRIHLPTMCLQLQEAGCYEGLVELALAAAEAADPNRLGVIAYQNQVDISGMMDEEDTAAARAMNTRNQCYGCIIEALNQLSATAPVPVSNSTTPSVSQRMQEHTANVNRDCILRTVFNSSDELAHVAIFRWLLERNMADVILKSGSKYVQRFLHQSIEQGGGQQYLDLLWRSYEKTGDYLRAAHLLQELADRPSAQFDLTQRLSYLAQAIMCAQSAPNSMSTEASELLQDLRDKMDVTRIQSSLRDALQSQIPGGRNALGVGGGNADVRQALDELNKQLYNATTLFQNYATRFDLPDIKLAIVHCAGHNDANIIEQLWKEIIDKEMASTSAGVMETPEVCMNRLKIRLVQISRKYINEPIYFPAEFICRQLHLRATANGFPPSWLLQTLQALHIAPHIMITVLNKQYRSRDPAWKADRRAQEQLMKTTLCLANDFADRAKEFPHLQRRAVKTELLDMFAAFTVDLQAATPVGERARLYEQTRLAKSRIELID